MESSLRRTGLFPHRLRCKKYFAPGNRKALRTRTGLFKTTRILGAICFGLGVRGKALSGGRAGGCCCRAVFGMDLEQ